MRRTLAAAVLGISLWFGSLAWSGFIMTRTVLDPGRSRDIADALYDNDAVRAQLVENIADALERAIPPELGVPRPLIENAAAQALASPAVEAVVVDAFVATHGAFLGEGEVPQTLDAGAFGAAAREALVAVRPDLGGVLPAAPSLVVDLPTERVPNLGPVRDVLERVVPFLAVLAAVGSLLALGVSSNRPAVLRRAGFWAIGLSAAVLAFAYGIPAIAERIAPDQAQIIAALIGAMAATTRGPAVALAAAGAAAIGTSLVWKVAPALAPSASAGVAPSVPASATGPRRDIPSPRQGQPRPRQGQSGVPAGLREPDGYAPGRVEPPLPPASSTVYAPTTVQPAPPPPSPPVQRPGQPAPPAARWVEGVGWVLESTESIPDNARWVPGVGYVVEG